MFTNRLLLRSLLLSFFPPLFFYLCYHFLSLSFFHSSFVYAFNHTPSSSRGVNAKKQNQNQRTDRIETLVRSIGGEQSVLARITSAKWCIPSWCLAKRINLPNNFQYIVSGSIRFNFASFLFFFFFFFSLYFLRSRFVPFRVYYFSRLLEIIKKYISLPRHPGLVVFLSAVMTSRDQGHAPCSQTVAVRPIRVNKPGSSIQSPLIRNPFSFFLESQDPIRKFN